MTRLFITAAAALALAGPAFAKAHDQGVADGEIVFAPGEAQTIIPGPGISAAVNKGTQGDAKKDPANRGGVDPVVGNGANDE